MPYRILHNIVIGMTQMKAKKVQKESLLDGKQSKVKVNVFLYVKNKAFNQSVFYKEKLIKMCCTFSVLKAHL